MLISASHSITCLILAKVVEANLAPYKCADGKGTILTALLDSSTYSFLILDYTSTGQVVVP